MSELVPMIRVARRRGRRGRFTAAGAVCMTLLWAGGRATTHAQIVGAPPTNVVANVYHSTEGGDNNRPAALTGVTDGDLRANQAEGFDTFAPAPETEFGQTDFAGLIYSGAAAQVIRFNTVTMTLGHQFGDGGSFSATPSLFLLVNNVDPNTADPESDPNYIRVAGATLVSPAAPAYDEPAEPEVVNDMTPPPPTQSPIIFDLTALADAERVGYGWAIGGVSGDGGVHFISVSELSATGTVIPEPASLGLLGLGAIGLLGRRQRR